MTTATTQTGVDTIGSEGINTDQAAEALLNKWKAAPNAPARTTNDGEKNASVSPEDTEDGSDEEELLEEETEGSEEDQSQNPNQPKYLDSDDYVVKVVVDGEEKTASVKDLKRLYGQEASLTRKSQEAAERRKQAEEIGNHYVSGLQRLVQMAEEEYKPYANIDFLVASKELTAEELQALRSEAQAKYQKYQFLTKELSGYTQQMNQQRTQMMAEQAKQTIAELSDPKTGIPGWGPDLYNQVCQFAVEQGMHPEVVASIVDAPSLRMLHQAFRYTKAKKVATTKKVGGPKTVIKSQASTDSSRFSGKSNTAMSQLRKTGSRDDAVAALLERWNSK